MTEIEQSIAQKLVTARFPPGTASKRFVRSLEAGYIRELSDRGRAFLAFVTHRFRRQYQLTSEEQAWVNEWLSRRNEAINGKAAGALVLCRPEFDRSRSLAAHDGNERQRRLPGF